mmetsp:Transcript_25503/g.39990  ORF Transcript_25503/g.39990 Transcript_25503/m.39990 type:complete len:171 (-) Transcript_25503:271-783(-)
MVHAILYFTASAGLAISLALAGEDRPWALDLEATAKLLGLGVAGDPQSQKQALDEWMQTVGGPEDNPKIRQLIGMLYISCAASCALTCCTILAVSFFAPRNRPLVFTMQGILVSGLYHVGWYFANFHHGSRHAKTVAVLFLANTVGIGVHILDTFLARSRKREQEKEKVV